MNLVNVSNTIIGDDVIQTVNARELHAFLGVGKDFSTWIKDRIEAYSFKDEVDYLVTKIGEQLPSGTKYKNEYYVSLDMAKELSMVDRGDKGKQVRRYFLDCEKVAKESTNRVQQLPTTFVEALEMLVASEKQKIKLSEKLDDAKPKVEFFDAVVESSLVYSLSEAAKLLDTGRTRFSNFLKDGGYMAQDRTPKQRYINEGLMDVKFTKYDTGAEVVVSAKPFITGKGLIYFRKKLALVENYLE